MNTSVSPKSTLKKLKAGKLNPKIPPQSKIRSEWVVLKIILFVDKPGLHIEIWIWKENTKFASA